MCLSIGIKISRKIRLESSEVWWRTRWRGSFLLEGKPVESLGFFPQRADLHQLHTLHGAVDLLPGVLADIGEDLPRLLEALKIPDRYNSPGIVGADAERHGITS